MSPPKPVKSALVGAAEAVLILSEGRDKVIDRAAVIRWGRQGRITIVHKIPGRNGAILFDRESVEKLAAELADAS
jgi:hypothetical protein